MGGRLATIDMGRKLGGCAPLEEGELGPHLTQCGLGWGLLRTKLHLDPSSHLATTDMAEIFFGGRGTVPLGEGSSVPI